MCVIHIFAMEVTFGVTSKGGRTACYHNYEFWQHRVTLKGTVVWRCIKHASMSCKACLVTFGNEVSGADPVHNHDVGIASVRHAVTKMKRKVEEFGAGPSHAIAAVCADISDEVMMALPKKQSLSDFTASSISSCSETVG